MIAEAFVGLIGIVCIEVGLWTHDWKTLAAGPLILLGAWVMADLRGIEERTQR